MKLVERIGCRRPTMIGLGLGLGILAAQSLATADDTADEELDAETMRDDTERKPASGSDEARSPHRALEATVGVPFWSRNLSYTDDLTGLRPHSIGPAPTFGAKIRWYPGAHVSSGVGAHLGLELSGMKSFGLSSRKDGVSYPTEATDFSVGVRGRVPLGRHELALVSGYGSLGITIEEPEGEEAVPDVAYRFLYVGSEGAFAFADHWRLGLRLAYLPVFATGELGEEPWFPRSTERGVEGGLTLSRDVTDFLAVTVGGSIRRFAFSMNPQPGDETTLPIAGGAIDQQLSAFVGVTGFLNGVTEQ